MQHTNAPSPLILIILPLMILILGLLFVRRKGYNGPDVVVRCRQGHLFTTVWIPGVSFKALRFGLVRFQYCPVGRHWAFVDIVNQSDLTDEQRRFAASHHDRHMP